MPKAEFTICVAALNLTSSRQRLPAGVSQSSLEEEPRTAVSNPAVIQSAAVVVPKLKADASPGDAGSLRLPLSSECHSHCDTCR